MTRHILRRLIPSFFMLLLLGCGTNRAPVELSGPYWLELPSQQQLDLADDDYSIWYFFSFRCEHCYQKQALLQQWQASHPKQPWQWIPLPFTHHQALSRTWLAAWLDDRDMPALAQLLFVAVHEQQLSLTRIEDIAPLVAQLGWQQDDFLLAVQSPQIDMMLIDLERSAKWLGVTQVPTLVVNGRWQLLPEFWQSEQALRQALSELPAR